MLKKHKYQSLVNLLFIVVGAIILCFEAIYNNYPLVFSDTGTYIWSGFENSIPFDRPIFYGWFLRHISLRDSFWLVIFTQGIVISSLIFLLIKKWIERYYMVYTLVILCLSFITGLSFHVSVLMPDVFTGVLILSILILHFAEPNHILTKIYCYILIVFSALVHNSNIVLLGAILFVFLVHSFIKRQYLVKTLLLLFTLFISISTMLTVSYIIDDKVEYSKGSNVFLMSRIIEMGLMNEFLEENCDKTHYEFCQYKDSIPNIPGYFLWHEKSPLYKTGGWEANNVKYKPLIYDFFTSTKYLKKFMVNAFKDSYHLIYHFDVAPYKDDSPKYHISTYLPEEIEQYNQAKQSNYPKDFSLLNLLQKGFVFVSFVFLLIVTFSKSLLSKKQQLFVTVLFYCITINAIICATLSDTASRYQARIIWLIPMIAIIILFEIRRKKSINRANNPVAEKTL